MIPGVRPHGSFRDAECPTEALVDGVSRALRLRSIHSPGHDEDASRSPGLIPWGAKGFGVEGLRG